MHHRHGRGPAPLLFAAIVATTILVPARLLAAFQAPAVAVTVAERLKQIEADLFAGGSHVKDDIRELTAILAKDSTIAEAHMLLGVAYRVLGTADMAGEARAEF